MKMKLRIKDPWYWLFVGIQILSILLLLNSHIAAAFFAFAVASTGNTIILHRRAYHRGFKAGIEHSAIVIHDYIQKEKMNS
jgi:hypothetical protein